MFLAAGSWARYRPGAVAGDILWLGYLGAQPSNRHSITVELVVLIVAALARPEVGKILYQFDSRDPFDHLEPKLVFATEPEGSAVQDAQGLAVHFVGENGQPVAHIKQMMRIVVTASIGAIGERIKHSVAR